MNFVNGMGRAQGIALAALLQPLVIVPFVVQVPHDGCGARRLFVQQADGIGLIDAIAMAIGLDVKLVERPLSSPGNESLPNSGGGARTEIVRFRVPAVEASDHRHRARVRRPYAENRARPAVMRGQVCAYFVVDAVVAAFVEQVEVVFGKKLRSSDSGFRAHGVRQLVYRTGGKIGNGEGCKICFLNLDVHNR